MTDYQDAEDRGRQYPGISVFPEAGSVTADAEVNCTIATDDTPFRAKEPSLRLPSSIHNLPGDLQPERLSPVHDAPLSHVILHPSCFLDSLIPPIAQQDGEPGDPLCNQPNMR